MHNNLPFAALYTVEVKMWLKMNAQLKKESRDYNFSFTCEECAMWIEHKEECSILYPNTPHRLKTIQSLQDDDRIYFCKMFEAK